MLDDTPQNQQLIQWLDNYCRNTITAGTILTFKVISGQNAQDCPILKAGEQQNITAIRELTQNEIRLLANFYYWMMDNQLSPNINAPSPAAASQQKIITANNEILMGEIMLLFLALIIPIGLKIMLAFGVGTVGLSIGAGIGLLYTAIAISMIFDGRANKAEANLFIPIYGKYTARQAIIGGASPTTLASVGIIDTLINAPKETFNRFF